MAKEKPNNSPRRRKNKSEKDLNELGREVLRVDVVGAPQDELVHHRGHLVLAPLRPLHLLVRGRRLPPGEDGRQKLLSERRPATEHLLRSTHH